ncbi:Aspartate--tRNA ligase [Planctomycetes bacterium Pan216]|uniref:Aspartate--tRNA(Asp/Asn) ligase n=1 Tax=Kolteria novifilia TaxID=2527975 RepID=A0A518B4G9_9BACT|nr:Aspartate--tRNA ligase [Planctomycetes bacterium Pan216]
MPSWQRTHTCGELRLDHEGEEATLNGWVNNWRDHGGLVFIDLRDRYGMTQVVFDPNTDEEMHKVARDLRSEYVISVVGKVAPRLEGKRNPKLDTGDIELKATKLELLNRSEVTPFEIGPEAEATSEEIRLRHRYLDLRRPRMQRILDLRHRVCKTTRDYLSERGFLEVETPMLGRSTPEGARDFLVPSRVNPGDFYALPQSPQLYKQILMVAGYDRYFQIARCFRDEDLRANRQPEFTQVDIEMSFIDMDDIIGLIEGLACEIMSGILGRTITPPFPRYTWDDLMRRYGVDRPDLRFGMEIVDITGLAHETDFKVFQQAPSVRGLNAKGAADRYSRKGLDELTAFAGEYGARGLAWLKVDANSFTSPIAKFFSEEQAGKLREAMGAEPGDLLLFVADRYDASHAPLAALRHRLGKELELYNPDDFHFSWCVDFPLLEHDADTGHWVARHHPFTMPLEEDWHLLETEPEKVRAKAYDLIVNGEEAAGGTIRLHKPDLQAKVFSLIGLDEEEAQKRFGFLLDALKYGAPPHGGIAMGLDRWVMLLAKLENIRDCIAFPKTQRATDLMTGAPSEVEPRHLRELGLK